jgi:hypothetical protein
MAPDQRYCLACGTRRGAPRVPLATTPEPGAADTAKAEQSGRPADVSPLAAVIGIALLGGMLLIGVLIGRGDTSDETTPAPIVQVGEGTGSTTTASTSDSGSSSDAAPSVTSEWPAGTDGFTVQLSTLPKSTSTSETVDSAKQSAAEDGAPAAAVLDSDLYASLPSDQYVIYSGVYSSQKEADAALEGLGGNFPDATVVEVSGSTGGRGEKAAPEDLGATGAEDTPIPGLTTPEDLSGGVTESEK